MSSNHFQNNRVVHRNATSAVQIGIDTQSSINKTNDKLDLALTQQTAVNTKLDSFSGAMNNASIGDGTVKLQTYVYGHDASAGQARALKVDATGRLECNVADIELHTGDISLSVDGLEGLIGTTNTKLQSDLDFAGQPNSIGDGSNMKRVMSYGHDSAGGQQRPLKIDAAGHLQVDCLSSALPSGGATEAKQDSGITHLATISGDTTSIDGKITACNTGAVVVSSSALPSGASTAALQGTANTALSEIEGAVENLELAVGTNTATAPTRSLQVGGKYQDGTFRDIKVDNIGKVIIDTPTGSDLDVRLATLGTNTTGLAGCVAGTELQVDVVSMPTTAVTLSGGATEAKQDVQETTLNAIQSAVELIDNAISGSEMQCDIVASLPAGTNAIGKLSANSGVDIGDVDVTSISAGTNRIGKVVLMGNEAADGSGTERHALLDSAGHLQIDVLSAPSTAVTNAGLTSLAAAVNSDRVDVNIANGGFGGAVTNAGLTAIDAAIGTDGSTGPTKCMSIGGTNPLGGAIQEIAVDGDGHLSVDILSSALPSGASQELSNSTIATKATLATSAEIKELLSGATVNQATLSAELDTEHYERIRLFGETSAAVGSDIKLFGSNTSGGTYYFLNNSDLQAQSLTVSGLGTVHYVGATLENIPRYIKVFNNSGSTNHTFTKLYMVGSGGRLAV